MTPDEIPQLIKHISLADPRIMPEDRKEVVAMAALWATVLADVPEDYAMHAVGLHYAKSPFTIKPSDISTRWASEVRDRMDRHTDPAPPVDPDDELAYRRAVHAQRHAVAQGARRPSNVAQLTSGGPHKSIERVAAGAFRSVNETLRPYVPEQARADIAAVRPGFGHPCADHPELLIPCPRPQCRAFVRRPCKSPRGREMTQIHPSRRRAWVVGFMACRVCSADIGTECRSGDGMPLIESVHPQRDADAKEANDAAQAQ